MFCWVDKWTISLHLIYVNYEHPKFLMRSLLRLLDDSLGWLCVQGSYPHLSIPYSRAMTIRMFYLPILVIWHPLVLRIGDLFFISFSFCNMFLTCGFRCFLWFWLNGFCGWVFRSSLISRSLHEFELVCIQLIVILIMWSFVWISVLRKWGGLKPIVSCYLF